MSAYDLSRLYIDFTQCPVGQKLASYYSELAAFKEFSEATDNEIKIAILSADIDSPFVRIKERETMTRAIFSYLEIDESKNNEFLENVIAYRDDKVNMCWVRYLQILHETDFTDWLLCRKDYDFFLQKSNEGKAVDESDDKYLARRNKIRETIKTLGQEVRAIEAKIFPDSKAAREAALAEDKNKIKLWAEKYSQEYTYL